MHRKQAVCIKGQLINQNLLNNLCDIIFVVEDSKTGSGVDVAGLGKEHG